MVAIVKLCKDCKKDFEISDKDQEFLQAQGWPPYVRCLQCRRLKKAVGFQKK